MLASLWPDTVVEENNLGQVISKLRQTLGEAPGDNAHIATMPGRGYRFVAETRVVEERLNDQAAAAGVPATDTPMMPSAEVSATDGFAAAGEGEHPLRRGMTRRVVAALLLLALCATLISLALARRGTGGGDRITSVAVLPFKPLLPQNRDQALEFGIADILIRSSWRWPWNRRHHWRGH
jgi:hypothetical protein